MATKRRRLRGYELRCVLTHYLFQRDRATVTELIDMLDFDGFDVAGRPSKAVSDALRCEMAHGRVVRLRRAQYRFASMPRGTEHRIFQRALALREDAAAVSAADDEAFWNAMSDSAQRADFGEV